MIEAPGGQAARWVTVLDEALLAQGRAVGVWVEGWSVVLARSTEALYALGGICPHDHASLGGGEVRDGNLVCPRHRACFALATGECVAGFSLPPLVRYPVRIRCGEVQVDAEAVEREPPGREVRERWDLTRG